MRKFVVIFACLFVTTLAINGCGNDAPTPPPTVAATATTAVSAPRATPRSAAPTAAPKPVPTLAPTQASKPTAIPTPHGDPTHGKELFTISCTACHGPTGEGVKGLGKDMTISQFIAGLSDAELLAFVKKGRLPSDPLSTTGIPMPPKGGNPALTDEQLTDIITYIRSIHKPK